MKRIGLIALATVAIIFVSFYCPEYDTVTSAASSAGIVIQ